MKYLPNFYTIRKKILFIAFIAICFFIGALKNLLASELSCNQTLSTCNKSCVDREGIYKFSCTGENFITNSPRSKCICGDSVDYEVHQQNINSEYRKFKILQNENNQAKK